MAKHKRKSKHKSGSKKRCKTHETEVSHDITKNDGIKLEDPGDFERKKCLFLKQYLAKRKARHKKKDPSPKEWRTYDPFHDKHAFCKPLIRKLMRHLFAKGEPDDHTPKIQAAFDNMLEATMEEMRT